jgi:RNA polymerase sigma-70 factor, ECF subfamily
MFVENPSEILDGCRKLDPDALTEAYNLYAEPIRSYVLRLSCDPVFADDAAQEVFTRAMENWVTGNGAMTNLRSYLYQSAYHLVVDESRLKSRFAPIEVVSNSAEAELWNPVAEESEGKIILDQAILSFGKDLTDDQRNVLILRYLEGFTLRETAEIIGKKINHVKVLQNRGVNKVREKLGFSGIEEHEVTLR